MKLTISRTMENSEEISQKSKDILTMAGTMSNNDVNINSGRRSPERQASAMYTNLSNGKKISYAAPGRAVVKIYDENKGKPKDEVISLMGKKIEELSKSGHRVSKHCVTKEEYAKNNIIDCGIEMENPRDFAISLMKWDDVTKIITPFSSPNYKSYLNKRIFLDTKEPAIHVEIKQ